MPTLPFVSWIANAAARLTGPHGAVTAQAREAECSRQTVYDHAAKVHAAVAAEHSGGPSREQLLQENQALREENARLWEWLSLTIEFPVIKQQEFSAVALAMGLSLGQIAVLLALLLGAKAAPARSTIHRWVQAAGVAAGRVLKRLDARCKVLVLVGCLDEIFFHRRPVLVGVEPASMVWFIGKKVGALRGSIWAEQLEAWDALQHVIADAGVPLQAGIARDQERRRREGRDPLDSTLDVFHTKHEARQALAIDWNRVERDWEAFEKADAQVRKDQRRGIDARPASLKASRAWAKVVKSFDHYEAIEAAWEQAAGALGVFRPDGRLNDRAWAEARVAPALPALVGRAWMKVANHLRTPESFTFLDRMHRELGQIPIGEELRDALVRLWWLRRQRPRKSVEGAVAGAGHVAHLVQQEICRKLDPNWRGWYRQVAAVLRGTVRASSAVECMNSVLRMHQSRHRTLTPGMLDVKRLYWNCREFRGGKRKGKCPYEHLGLGLASYDFWGLLKEEFSAALDEAKVRAKEKLKARAA
ncbi:MAG: hypothetical protein ACXVCF_21670 [Isosphaeraceae bacterium]